MYDNQFQISMIITHTNVIKFEIVGESTTIQPVGYIAY